jgi:hypothetical protein
MRRPRQPKERMNTLQQAHAKLAGILGPERTECFEAAMVVEQLRRLWRPDRVRVILLAESHVWTSREEASSRVLQPDGIETGFARFIYCLGGGEREIVTPAVTRDEGAFKYWRLMHDTVRGPSKSYRPLLKSGEPNSALRLENKLGLLNEVRKSGVWLVDASIAALVREGKRLADGPAYRAVLRECSDAHVGTIVCEASPAVVIIIGKSVEKAIGEIVRRDLGDKVNIAVIKQPEGVRHRDELADYREQIFALCQRKPDSISSSPDH